MPDEDDFITEDDIAAGFLQFSDGFDSGYRLAEQLLSEHLNSFINDFGGRGKELINGFLKSLDLEYYCDPRWIAGIRELEAPDECAFEVWRRFHPRDLSSPEWDGVR